MGGQLNVRSAGGHAGEPMVHLVRGSECVQVLSKSEVEWVNSYHKEVWEKASPRMSGDVLDWLRENTAPLEVPTPQVAAMA